MTKFKNSDLKTFEQLVKLDQESVKKVMAKFLKKNYYKVIETKDYIFCEGNIPIGLVAHMDTVFTRPPEEIYYDERHGVVFSPDGLGADDRAGIFAILKILQSGLRPHIILTTDEESGGLGARALAELDCPFRDLRFLIELDRNGSNDCVFYDCDNRDFVKYIEEFGFVEAFGTFTDICFLCKSWGVAGVNLSIGYRDEHTYTEILFVGHMMDTIKKVEVILSETDIPFFKYVPSPWTFRFTDILGGKGFSTNSEVIKCEKCKAYFPEEDMFPVIMQNGSTKFYCTDCLVDHVSWCDRCQSAYEKYSPEEPDIGICPLCEKEGAV